MPQGISHAVGREFALALDVVRAGQVPGGEGPAAAQVHQPLPRRRPRGELRRVGPPGRGEVDRGGAGGVRRGHVGVVGGDVLQAGEQVGHEGVGVLGQRVVVLAFFADGGGVALDLAGGAETAEAVGGQHPHVVGECVGQTVRRGVLVAGEPLGQPGFDQVGASHGADQQGAAGERGHRRAAVLEDIGRVVRSVAGSGQRPQREPPVDGDRVAVRDGGVREGHRRPVRHQVPRAADPGQFQAAGDVVVVQVRLGHEGRSMTSRAADPDTLVASAKAYLGALNKIVMKRQRDVPVAAAGH